MYLIMSYNVDLTVVPISNRINLVNFKKFEKFEPDINIHVLNFRYMSIVFAKYWNHERQ